LAWTVVGIEEFYDCTGIQFAVFEGEGIEMIGKIRKIR
jgi:hypothetical protein